MASQRREIVLERLDRPSPPSNRSRSDQNRRSTPPNCSRLDQHDQSVQPHCSRLDHNGQSTPPNSPTPDPKTTWPCLHNTANAASKTAVEINEARPPDTRSICTPEVYTPYAVEMNKKKKRIQPHSKHTAAKSPPKHSSTATAATARDGLRRNKPHALKGEKLARFCRRRACGNRSRTGLVVSDANTRQAAHNRQTCQLTHVHWKPTATKKLFCHIRQSTASFLLER